MHTHTHTLTRTKSKTKDPVERKTNLIRKVCFSGAGNQVECVIWLVCVCCGKRKTDMNKVLDLEIVFVAIASGSHIHTLTHTGNSHIQHPVSAFCTQCRLSSTELPSNSVAFSYDGFCLANILGTLLKINQKQTETIASWLFRNGLLYKGLFHVHFHKFVIIEIISNALNILDRKLFPHQIRRMAGDFHIVLANEEKFRKECRTPTPQANFIVQVSNLFASSYKQTIINAMNLII